MMEQNTTNKPLRRVGTLTLGVCLIAAGTLFLLARFLPGLPWLVIWQVLPAAGLILLGCEVLYYSARPGACRCDFGSVVLWVLRRLDPYAAGPDAGPRLHHPPVNTRKPVQPPCPKPCGRKIGVKPRRRLWAVCKKEDFCCAKSAPPVKRRGAFVCCRSIMR
jgi:hypothetical protein